MVRADHLGHERLPRRILEGIVEAEQRGEYANLPDLKDPEHRQQPHRQRLHSHHRLQDDHQAALVDAVGDHAAVRAQQQYRQRLQRDDQSEHGARTAQLQDDPRLGGHLHPGADQRHRLAADVPAVVGNLECGERDSAGAPDARQRDPSRRRSASSSSAGIACSRIRRSAAGRVDIPRLTTSVRSRRIRSASRWPSSVT